MNTQGQKWVQSQAEPERPTHYPEYIYGLHESGGEQFMLRAERRGWILELAAIGLDGKSTPADFSKLAAAGLGVIVRINHGYGSTGTLPTPDRYLDFAAACAAYVQRSSGCHIWIIGNEPNHQDEHPDHRPILPHEYAKAYELCRTAIRALPGHEQDQVLVAGPAPWNATTNYPGNEKGDWVRYFVHTMMMLDDDGCDGISLHTYTHDLDVSQIDGDFFHTAHGYTHLRNEFRSYRDFMNAIPDRFRHLPVFITEADPSTRSIGWNPGHNVGWVRAAYREIATWNSNPNHQPILSLILYRWPLVPDQPEWSISNRAGIVEDFAQALEAEPAADYRIRLPRKLEPHVVLEPGALLKEQWDGMVASPLGLNQRTGPTTEHAILQLLPNETAVKVMGELDEWLYVEAMGRLGYVSRNFIQHQRASGYMPLVLTPGKKPTFLRERKELQEAPLAPEDAEKITLNLDTASWTQKAVATAWNEFGSLVNRIAKLLEIDPAVAVALLAIESGGHAFNEDGRMLVRFEPHIFFEEWGKLDPERFAQHFRFRLEQPWQDHQWRLSGNQEWRNFHGNQRAEWEVLEFARNSMEPEAALRSTSMGAPQIMGFNHALIGYPSAKAMFEAFSANAHAQIIGLFDFVKIDPIRLNALRTGDYMTFANSYNGSGQAALYASLIQDGVNAFNSLHTATSTADTQPDPVLEPVPDPEQEPEEKLEEDQKGNKEEASQLPAPSIPSNLAEIDPELYAAWRKHVVAGFTNNHEMFERLVEAFMGPYHTTVLLYRLTFAVGLLSFMAAVVLSLYTGQVLFGVVFGGIGVSTFLSYFMSRPLRALEENLNFITWLGVIYNSYWTRLVYAMNMDTVQQDITSITDDFTKQMQDLIDKSAALNKDRPGLR